MLKVDMEGIIEMMILDEVRAHLGIDNIQIISEGMTEVVVVGLDQVQEPVLIETELDAIGVGYDHFTKDCQTLQVDMESEQIQQMYNMDKEQTALKVLAADTYDNLNILNSIDETIVDHLNL